MIGNSNPILDVAHFMRAVGQETGTASDRQLGLYIGMQLEEMAEKMDAIFGRDSSIGNYFIVQAEYFKRGVHDDKLAALPFERKVDMLDADLDQVWVSLGAALSLGADVPKAWGLLVANNMAKIDPSTGKARRDANGKITKPEGHQPPDFRGCFI